VGGWRRPRRRLVREGNGDRERDCRGDVGHGMERWKWR